MGREPRHPRVVGGIERAIELGIELSLVGIVLLTAAYLGSLALFGGTALAFGLGVHPLGLATLAALGIVPLGVVAGVVVVGGHRIERFVRATDERPDPVDELTERYVDDEIDREEFERRVGEVYEAREGERADSADPIDELDDRD